MDTNATNGHTKAVSRALRLGESLLQLLAREHGLTAEQVCSKLLEKLWEASEAGNLDATKELHGYVAAAWVGQSPNSAKAMLRHHRKGMRLGILSLDDGVRASKLAQVQREVENAEGRLRELEGAVGTLIRTQELE